MSGVKRDGQREREGRVWYGRVGQGRRRARHSDPSHTFTHKNASGRLQISLNNLKQQVFGERAPEAESRERTGTHCINSCINMARYRTVTLVLLCLMECGLISAFNLDTENVIRKTGEPDSFFGFSLALHRQLRPDDRRM